MPLPNSIRAYADIEKVVQAADETERGVRIRFKDKWTLVNFRNRFHKWKAMKRKLNSQIYPPENPLHNDSGFDHLCCRKVDEELTLLIVKYEDFFLDYDISAIDPEENLDEL